MSKRPKHAARRVRLCKHTQPGPGAGDNGQGRGGRPILYAFSWDDLAALFRLRPETVRRLARAGKFDPTDLESVARMWLGRATEGIDAPKHFHANGSVTKAPRARIPGTGPRRKRCPRCNQLLHLIGDEVELHHEPSYPYKLCTDDARSAR